VAEDAATAEAEATEIEAEEEVEAPEVPRRLSSALPPE
jgi:hypothetical protein